MTIVLVTAAILSVGGALFCAFVGWLVENFSRLTQIARNTARRSSTARQT